MGAKPLAKLCMNACMHAWRRPQHHRKGAWSYATCRRAGMGLGGMPTWMRMCVATHTATCHRCVHSAARMLTRQL